MTEYVLASASGLRAGLGFAVALAAAIAASVYLLLTKPRFRRHELGPGAVRRPMALVVASVLALPVVAAIYWTSIAGFHRVTLGGRDLRLGYVLPERSVIVPYNQVVRVVRRPAYKSLWRLQVYTVDGRTLQSTRGAESAVVTAATALEQRLAR